MLSSRLYYRLKPYLPWRLRMGVRRVVARVQRRHCAQTWPINELAGRVARRLARLAGREKIRAGAHA